MLSHDNISWTAKVCAALFNLGDVSDRLTHAHTRTHTLLTSTALSSALKVLFGGTQRSDLFVCCVNKQNPHLQLVRLRLYSSYIIHLLLLAEPLFDLSVYVNNPSLRLVNL